VVEASVLLGEGRPRAAVAVAEPHLSWTGRNASRTWAVEAGIRTALAAEAAGDRPRVIKGLDVALAAAEEEGFRRPFAAGGPVLRELVTAAAPNLPGYRHVIHELAGSSDVGGLPHPPAAVGRPRAVGALVDPLTEREITVLRYLQGTMSNVEIAA